MTDAEKELRRLADAVKSGARDFDDPRNDMWPLSDHCAQETATTVLDLLDRIEALERQVNGAERDGAEAMRRASAKEARAASDWIEGGAIARRIDDLPLPGDAP